MKVVNFKISVMALAISLVMVSCGGGGQQSAEQKTQNATEKTVQKAVTENEFTAEALSKIASLGKSENDKRLVVRNDAKWGTMISVYEWKNGEYLYTEYTFVYPSKKASSYDRPSVGERVTEKSDSGLWYAESGETSAKSWQEHYDEFKNNPDYRDYKVVE